jgi:hypothetical protein
MDSSDSVDRVADVDGVIRNLPPLPKSSAFSGRNTAKFTD